MKLVLLSFSIRNSSVSDFFIELSNQLSKNNRVIIITDYLGNHPFYISPGIEIIRWPAPGPKSFKAFRFLFRIVYHLRPVAMISNFSSVGPFLIIGYLLRVPNRIAWCHSISNQFLDKRPFIDKKKMVYRMATSIFANSNATKQDLLDNFSIRDSKVDVCYNAVRDINKISEIKDNQIIYVGRINETKGVGVLLKAMREVIKEFPNLNLKIYGGSLKDRSIDHYKLIAEKYLIAGNVHFLGYLPKNKILDEFSSSYLTVVPSLVEAFGYVVIESFSVKTPVIGSHTTGIAEIIRDEKDGYLFKVGDSKDLAQKILFLLRDNKMREEFSVNCYKRFKETFEIEKVVKGVCENIEKKLIDLEKK